MADDLLRIEYVPLDEVQRWPRNPKKHDMGALVAAIERYGFVDPPKWDATLGALVYGNGRDEALEWMKMQGRAAPRGVRVDEHGRWLIPVKFGVDAVSSTEAEALAIDHNNLTMSGGDFTAFDMARMWDASYTDVLAGLQIDDALPLTLDDDALAALLAGAGEAEAGTEEDDDAPAIDEDKPTRVQLGDVWRVGEHLVCCLDSTDRVNIEKWAGQITFVVADPPYGIDIVATDGYVGGGAKYDYPFGGVKGFVGGTAAHKARTGRYYIEETHGKKRSGLGTANGAKPFGDAAIRGSDGASNRIPVGLYAPVIGDDSTDTAISAALLALDLFPKAVQFWWGANNYANALPPSTCWIVWDKENTGNFADAELAWSNHKSAVRIFKHMWNGLMKASERGERRTHPTQKPVALFTWLYERYGKPGDLVLDPFLGSGPSLKAAHRLGDRRVVGFELSPHYCTHIIEWAEAAGLTCTRVGE